MIMPLTVLCTVQYMWYEHTRKIRHAVCIVFFKKKPFGFTAALFTNKPPFRRLAPFWFPVLFSRAFPQLSLSLFLLACSPPSFLGPAPFFFRLLFPAAVQPVAATPLKKGGRERGSLVSLSVRGGRPGRAKKKGGREKKVQT